MATKAQQKHKRQRDSWKPSLLPFQADYNDHFESSIDAYRDILPLLDYLEENRDSHHLYDPFYCNGRAKVLLNQLGFSNVIHHCRDFYKDVDNRTFPDYDTLVTNPPYSDDHKERCLSFALEQLRTNGRSFFILMPNYVAARNYFRRLLQSNPQSGVVYVIPSTPYEYDHPEGTGHTVSPFDSIWFCGIGADRVGNVQMAWNKYLNDPENKRGRPRLVTSLNELERLKEIPTGRRPNPRQRRKRRKKMEASTVGTSVNEAGRNTVSAESKQTKSRHRNENGERKRKPF
jgi:hypothetical protein